MMLYLLIALIYATFSWAEWPVAQCGKTRRFAKRSIYLAYAILSILYLAFFAAGIFGHYNSSTPNNNKPEITAKKIEVNYRPDLNYPNS